MRMKFLVAAAMALAGAGAAEAQRPQYLPTSKVAVSVPASTTAPAPAVIPATDPENILNLDLSTGGRVTIQLRPDAAPQHVARIKALARQGFYNGIIFHRVIEGFMAQTGDPTGTGTGGSPLPDLAAEFNALPHLRGAVSAARASDLNSANSQFFIVFSPRFSLDGKYSVFGRVVSGMQYVDAIERGEPPAAPSRIVRASIAADNLPPPTPAEVAAAMQRPLAPVTPPPATAQAAQTAEPPASPQ
jgi:cyclophilin family peptidyl-prolyl cis-trans isomerase